MKILIVLNDARCGSERTHPTGVALLVAANQVLIF